MEIPVFYMEFDRMILTHLSFIIYHSSFIIHHLSFIIHYLSFIIYHLSFIIHYSSFIIHHLSFIIHHSSFINHSSLFIILHSTYTHAVNFIQVDLRQPSSKQSPLCSLLQRQIGHLSQQILSQSTSLMHLHKLQGDFFQ